ncbi:ATP-binding protein [Pararhizobium sp. A13]|uniref:ATP-binding protein n=1 Tax=Pararhizobium sp. A13 TaxID=3133975 RepID=UPI00324D9708
MSGFQALASLHQALSAFEGEHLCIDCATLSWLDAHLSAPFQTIALHCVAKGNRLQLANLRDSVRTILKKNGLLKDKAPDTNHTTMPVTRFELHQEVEFANYTRRHMARREMPAMTPQLKAKFYEGIDELFANSSLHSSSKIRVTVAGQFFPRNERLSFSISDGGRGIDGSLRAAGLTILSSEDAIDWAMQPNNTSRHGDIPGGLGLRLIRDFVEVNRGTLTVCSSSGFWMQNGSEVSKKRLRHRFPGTAVVLDIMTSDKNRYDLKAAQDPRNIW